MNLNNNMNDREKYFFDNVEIKPEDIERAKRAIFSKGIEKHIIILDKLKAWIENDKVPYELIASLYRYDKRLRETLYKYISYLEEYYRSLLLDNYRSHWSGIVLKEELNKELNKTNDFNSALEEISFSTLINQVVLLKDNFGEKFVFPNMFHFTKNKDALIELRNCVMHNKMLALFRGYKECYLSDANESKGTTLKDNIINLIHFLPEELREKCMEEIKDCASERNNEGKTAWAIPNYILVDVER